MRNGTPEYPLAIYSSVRSSYINHTIYNNKISSFVEQQQFKMLVCSFVYTSYAIRVSLPLLHFTLHCNKSARALADKYSDLN